MNYRKFLKNRGCLALLFFPPAVIFVFLLFIVQYAGENTDKRRHIIKLGPETPDKQKYCQWVWVAVPTLLECTILVR